MKSFITLPKDKYLGFLTGHLLRARKRLDFFKWAASHGEYTHFRLGTLDVYLFTNPDAVNHILKKNARNYTKDTPSYKVMDRVTGKGVFTESGEPWLKIRKVTQPFFSNKQTEHWERIVDGVCHDLEQYLKNVNDVHNFSPLMTRLTLRILGETIFDKDLGEKSAIFDKELRHLIYLSNEMITNKFSLNIPKKIEEERQFKKSMKVLDELISDLIDEARKDTSNNPNNMIHAFFNAPYETDQQFLIDQVKTMAFAGHETTSTVLSWGLHFLSINPDWQEKIYQELKAHFPDLKLNSRDIEKCEQLEMFINESIRMYPPAWGFSRRALEDDEIEGYKIKAGSVVAISPYLMGYDEKYWIRPEEFNPLRFSLPEHVEKRHPYSYIPFGMGPRACIGEKLSRMELRMILSTFIKDYHLKPSEKHPVVMEPTLTLSLKGGIHLRLEKRV